MTILIESPAFPDGGTIPKLYTCDGKDVSPPLAWSGVPEAARSLALICEDPDAPRGTWTHWVIFNVPATVKSLGERRTNGGTGHGGGGEDPAHQGTNDFGKIGYGGPCPPGGTHHYLFRIYARTHDWTWDRRRPGWPCSPHQRPRPRRREVGRACIRGDDSPTIRQSPQARRPNEGHFMSSRLTSVSKYLSKYLRHAPDELGLTLQPGGWVPVDDLLEAADRGGFPITYDELVECVETNDKQRFSFDVTGELIRANQGHSVEVDLQLEEREPPEVLYHGTVARFLASIMAEGLDKGKRHHVHLSKDVETARKVGVEEGPAGHPRGRCRADAPGGPQILPVGQRRLADGHRAPRLSVAGISGYRSGISEHRTSTSTRKTSSAMILAPSLFGWKVVGKVLVPEFPADIDQRDLVLLAVLRNRELW